MGRIILVLFLCASLFSCQKAKFSVDSEWLIPLLKTEMSIGDLLADSLTSKNADNSVNLAYTYEYEMTDLTDFFEVPDRVENVEVTLESLVLDDRGFKDTVTLLEIYPASIFLHGQTQTLPAQDVQTDEGTEIDVTEEFFTTATFKEGWIDIYLQNDLPVVAEIVEFELVNADDDEVVLSGIIENLQPGTTDSSSYDLAGKTVDGLLEMRVKRVKTAESTGPVLIDVYKGLIIEFNIRDLKPESATAIFPAQTLLYKEDQTEYMFGGAQLTVIEVATGDILMKVSSSIEEAIILDYEIPSSYKNGSTTSIKKSWTIPAAPKGQTIEVEERFPIDDFFILMKGKDENVEPYTNHIYNILEARIEYSGVERTLSLTDKISIEFGLVDVKPYRVSGDPGLHTFQFADTFDVPLFKNVNGGISLEDASFNMHIENGFGIEMAIDASNIEGINNREPNTTKLVSPEIVNPIYIDKASNTNGNFMPEDYFLSMDKSNSNFKLFLENMPDQIVPNLELTVRPNGTYQLNDFAFNYSEINADFEILIPLKVGLDSLTLVTTQDFKIDNKSLENLKSIKLMARGDNSFPLEASIQVDILDISGNVLLSVFNNGENTIEAAEVDPISGKTTSTMQSEIIANLDADRYTLLQQGTQAKVYARFNTENATRYTLYDDYKLGLKVISDFVYD